MTSSWLVFWWKKYFFGKGRNRRFPRVLNLMCRKTTAKMAKSNNWVGELFHIFCHDIFYKWTLVVSGRGHRKQVLRVFFLSNVSPLAAGKQQWTLRCKQQWIWKSIEIKWCRWAMYASSTACEFWGGILQPMSSSPKFLEQKPAPGLLAFQSRTAGHFHMTNGPKSLCTKDDLE